MNRVRSASLRFFSCFLVLASFARADLLEPVEGFKPIVRFKDRYSDYVKRLVEREPGKPPLVTYEPQFRTSVAFVVTANTRDVDLSVMDENAEVSISIGTFFHSATLGEDPKWRPGKRRAAFNFVVEVGNPESGDVRLKKIGRITYSWNEKRLIIVASCVNSGSIVAETMSINDPGSFYELAEIEVGFGGDSGFLNAYAKGKVKRRTKTYGQGKDAQPFELYTVNSVGTLTPPPEEF